MMRLKVYKQGRETLVAACDNTIVGRHLREGRAALLVSEAFYGTEQADEATLVNHLRLCTVANLVGEKVVSLAIRHGFVNPSAVLVIEGVPHAQIAKFL